MKSLRRRLLDTLVARRPVPALQQASRALGVCAVQLRLPAHSPLHHAQAPTVELPLDEVIAPYVLAHGRWQSEECEFLRAHAPPLPCVLVDVGANLGLITRQLIHRLPSIHGAACFEPHPGNFAWLRRNLAHLPQCVPVQAALGSHPGELTFYEEEGNAGNYSLNVDAMRGRRYRTSTVVCQVASEAALMAPLPVPLRAVPLLWKSDTQGFDELIMTTLEDSFWARVQAGVMEMWRIQRPDFDRARLAHILGQFPIRRFSPDAGEELSVAAILEYASGLDYQHSDLYFARS